MVDGIQGAGGDAIRKAAEAGGNLASQQEQSTKSSPSKFDDVMKQKDVSPAHEIEAQKAVLETNVEMQINTVTETEMTSYQADFDKKVSGLDQPQQVRYFAVRIRESKEVFLKMKNKTSEVQNGPMKDKLVERLDEFGVEYNKMESMMDKMSSGHEFSQGELLQIQIRAHKIQQSVEVLSKAVEHSVGGMKTIFQTNV